MYYQFNGITMNLAEIKQLNYIKWIFMKNKYEVRNPKFAYSQLLSPDYLFLQFYNPYNDNNSLPTKMIVEPI